MFTVVPPSLDSIGSRRIVEHLLSHSFHVGVLLWMGRRVYMETAPIRCYPYGPHCVVECDVLSYSSVPVCTHVAGAEEEGAVLLFVVILLISDLTRNALTPILGKSISSPCSSRGSELRSAGERPSSVQQNGLHS